MSVNLEWQTTVKQTLVHWLIFNLAPLPKPDMQTMSSLPECACRIYHAVVCQQKPVDPCTFTLSYRAGCYHSNLLRTLPSNCLRFILDTPLGNALSQWECVCVSGCVFLSVCLSALSTDWLHMTVHSTNTEVWPSYHSIVSNWKVFSWRWAEGSCVCFHLGDEGNTRQKWLQSLRNQILLLDLQGSMSA